MTNDGRNDLFLRMDIGERQEPLSNGFGTVMAQKGLRFWKVKNLRKAFLEKDEAAAKDGPSIYSRWFSKKSNSLNDDFVFFFLYQGKCSSTPKE